MVDWNVPARRVTTTTHPDTTRPDTRPDPTTRPDPDTQNVPTIVETFLAREPRVLDRPGWKWAIITTQSILMFAIGCLSIGYVVCIDDIADEERKALAYCLYSWCLTLVSGVILGLSVSVVYHLFTEPNTMFALAFSINSVACLVTLLVTCLITVYSTTHPAAAAMLGSGNIGTSLISCVWCTFGMSQERKDSIDKRIAWLQRVKQLFEQLTQHRADPLDTRPDFRPRPRIARQA